MLERDRNITQGRIMQMNKNDLGNIFNMNMNKGQFVQLSKLLNTMYDDYGYMTLEDYNKVDEIDNRIFDIDKQLYFVLTGEKVEGNDTQQEDVLNNNEEPMTISRMIQNAKENTSNPYLKFIFNMGGIVDDIIHKRGIENKVPEMTSKKLSPDELLLERNSLVSERDNIIKTSKDRMKENDPEQYKIIQEMMTQQRLAMKTGNFDFAKILGL